VSRKRLKSLAPDLSHLTRLAPVANCISPVTTAIAELGPGVPGYPQRLFALALRPALEVRGRLAERPAVAIVGARAASAAGMARAHALGRHLAARGVDVVSGGALGIDGAAHRGALAGGGATTVVLGSGIDVLYPQRHAALFEQIVASGGALVSMFPRGMAPRATTFPQRNPLIAALADIVIVVEAELASGSLGTARAARELGRVVCAHPGSAGCERLLASGAGVIEDDDDAIAALAGAPRQRTLDPIAAQVIEAIAAGAVGIDGIVRATGLAVRSVLRVLPLIDVSARKQ